MSASVYSDSPSVPAALRHVASWMQRAEMELSRFQPDSDLSRLNAQAGHPYQARPILWQATQAALTAAAASEGVFDPTIGGALIAAGYDRSFELLGSGPTTLAPPPLTNATWQDIEMDTSTHTIILPPGVHLDLGGIAKGWAADRALAMLAPLGPALVDAGGDLAVGQAPPGARGWPISVADPLVPEDDIAILLAAETGLATSGTDFRRWTHNARRQHHLIDPKRRLPADTSILSTTVVAPTAAEADVMALVLTVLDTPGATAWLETHPLPALIILTDGRSYQTPTFSSYVNAYYPIYRTSPN